MLSELRAVKTIVHKDYAKAYNSEHLWPTYVISASIKHHMDSFQNSKEIYRDT